MRNELEIMEYIENYLLNNMTPTEKYAFENEMHSDPALKAALEDQQLLMSGLKHLAIKESIHSSGKKYFLKKILIQSGLAVIGAIAAVCLALFLKGNEPKADKPFINPPLQGINIPYSEYTVDPTNPSDITCPSGSVIRIPKNAFVDQNGKPVDHLVRLKYREFRDPADIFIAGIPMTYDSAADHFYFESAGMFELLGFDGDKPIAIDTANPIKVDLVSLSSEDKFNQYYLDTVKRGWEYISTDEPITQAEIRNNQVCPAFPLVPIASDPSKYRISIEADANEFPELAVYKEVKFEVSDENEDFDPKWSDKIWDKAALKRMDNSKYIITFEKGKEKHEIITYPVLDSLDREKAIKEFQLKTEQYNSLLRQKENSDHITEKGMEEQLHRLDSSRISQDKDAALQQQNILRNANERQAAGDIVMRTFVINRFGVWNSDCPSRMPKGANLWAKFSDDNNDPLYFDFVYLVEKGRNAIFTYYNKNFSNFSFNPNAKNMVWAVTSEGKLAVCSEEEFTKAKWDSKALVFKMHIVSPRPANEQEVRQILGY